MSDGFVMELCGNKAAWQIVPEGITTINSVEVLTLHVFDDRQLKRFLVIDLTDDDGNLMQSSALRSPPAALSGNNFEDIGALVAWAHQQRLHDALFANRIGQVFEQLWIKVFAGVGAACDDELDGQSARPRRFRLARSGFERLHVSNQGGEAAAETSGFIVHCVLHQAARNWRSRLITSVANRR